MVTNDSCKMGDKTCLRGFKQCKIQTSLLSFRDYIEKIEISLVSSLDIILSTKRITKALISLRGCTGSSAHLLFANPPKTGFLAIV